MSAGFSIAAFARACGFAAGWAVFTLALLLATRPMGIGPGFSRPLPYAAAALIFSCAGHLIRLWLREELPPVTAAQGGMFRKLWKALLRGLSVFFKGTTAFNNFVFLSVAYFIGIGLTSLFIRKEGAGKKASGPPEASYWKDLNLGKRDADAYYRPY
jgi:hypothetical protein